MPPRKKNNFGRDTPLGSFMVKLDRYLRNKKINEYFHRLGPFQPPPPEVAEFYNFIYMCMDRNIIQTLANSNDTVARVYNRYVIEGRGDLMNLCYFFWADAI